ncbi:MAG: isoleucine--tRNA ligase [Candidatus Woesearchaeota archaeon]
MKYKHKKVEEDILKYWDEEEIYKAAKEKNNKNQKFYFLDGPPYTSGKIHIGTAWNKVLKDSVLRYKRMKGLDVWDRAGYDMHGLPIENKVMNNLDFNTKEEIYNYSVEKFIKKCESYAIKYMDNMNTEFKRLGVWMDFDNAYKPIDNDFMAGVWHLIKKAHKKDRLYKGERTMTWCKSCETALSKHELEYENVTDTSIYVKYPLKNKKDHSIIIWTTTPWTIPFNLGVMAGPDIEYGKYEVDVDGKTEYWILAKRMAGILFSSVFEKKSTLVETFKGSELEGLEYTHPFNKELGNHYSELKENHENVHTIVLSSEHVDLSAGTGLVHMAPGCGPEDYEVGLQNDIPPFNTLDETGTFPEDMDKFSGYVAKDDDHKFIQALEENKRLIATNKVEHDYPYCARCSSPVVFRTTEQWFFKVEDLKDKLRKANEKTHWVPDWAGSNAFDSWLENLRDNSITRQRFWGTPVPIWECSCGNIEVIGSLKELKRLAGSVPENIHKPYIDDVTIKCSECKKDMNRIPDVLDVWVDSGTTSWNCLNYPQDKENFKKYFPADFIAEGKDQIRGWFNLLMISSFLTFDEKPFKNVFMHGFISDSKGLKMSKSIGNVVRPMKVINQYGADAFRLYSLQNEAGEDLNFSFDELKNHRRSLNVLWNVSNYLQSMTKLNDINPDSLDFDSIKDKLTLSEEYILSRMNKTIKEVTELMEDYMLHEVPGNVEQLFLDISRKYIRAVRKRLTMGDDEDKKVVLYTLYTSLLSSLKLLAPFCPYMSEKIYLTLKEKYGLEKKSIHLFDWPTFNEKLFDDETEVEFDFSQKLISSIKNIRSQVQRSVRWPIKEVSIDMKEEISLSEDSIELIKKRTNAKEIIFEPKEYSNQKELDIEKAKIIIDLDLNHELKKEGYYRELIRRIQSSRKKMKLKRSDLIELVILGDKIFSEVAKENEDNLKNRIEIKEVSYTEEKDMDFVEDFKIKDKSLTLQINKL